MARNKKYIVSLKLETQEGSVVMIQGKIGFGGFWVFWVFWFLVFDFFFCFVLI